MSSQTNFNQMAAHKILHKILHGLLLIALISAQFAQFVAFPTAAAQAHSGDVVAVPVVPSAPPMDAECTNAQTGFGNAAEVSLAPGIKVLIERTNADLYLCFVGMDPRDWFSGEQPEPGKDDTYLYLDIPHDGPSSPGIHQYQLRASAASATTVDKYGSSGNTTVYSGADPGGWDAVGKNCVSCGEFQVTWQSQMRISLSTLGGSWDHTLGFMVAYENDEAAINHPWPATSDPLAPNTWADLQLSGGPEPHPSIDSFDPAIGDAPHFASNTAGTLVHIHGYNLCAGNPVIQFGSAPAIQPQSCSADGSELQVRVAQLSVSGPLTLLQTTGVMSQARSTSSFIVRTFRNQQTFKFTNIPGRPRDLSVGDYAEVFGADQFFVGIDPCAPFGGHCRIPLPAPDPIAFAFFGITKAILEGNGACFGMVLASQRLMRGDVPFTQFGTSGPTVWSMDTPAGPTLPGLEHFIKLAHISQMSGEFLGEYLRQSAFNATSPVAQQQVRRVLADALAPTPHDFRLIALRKGGEGHLVLAYDLEAGTPANGGIGNGDYFIYVYDPNQPFALSENTNASQHQMSEVTNGRIHVTIDNRWVFIGNFADSPWSGDMGGLVVAPYSLIPRTHPTMPSITDVVGTVFFASGAIESSQVSDAEGHLLLNPDGSVNHDPATAIPDATRFAAMAEADTEGSAGANSIYLLGHNGVYTHEVVGVATGVYSQTVIAHNFTAGIHNIETAENVRDEIAVDTQSDGLRFQSGSAQKALDMQMMVRNDAGATRLFGLQTTSFQGGSDALSFDQAHLALRYTHNGATTEARIVLGWTAPDSSPATFLLPTLTVHSGDSMSITVENWSSLLHTTVTVLTRHQDGSTETQHLTQQPLIRLTSNQISAAGEASFQATAYAFGNTDLAGVDASCSGAADAWQTVAPLSGAATQTVDATFNLTDPHLGCTEDNRTFYVGVRDGDGNYLAIVPLTVPTSGTVPGPITGPITGPVTTPITDPITEPITDPITDPINETEEMPLFMPLVVR